ncbi:ATP synthase subunit I [Alcanivorax jadensis T9]|uniref:ATP synthase subunit I n=1 Tax=Alcanivorax jadensis T9 TaxID=1177181 RepID=A0ABR4WE03_9GAMM|nr:ATP synthase subunit I [Alcanivorax jadensis]KGD61746.1 ATP synthase subunit I [Alcanivorax jadensis T9]
MTSNEFQPNRTLFWGLMRAQLATLVIFALLVTSLAGTLAGLVAAWGGTISLIAYAWGGFQLWMHPGNRAPKRLATAAIRAEMGKIAIMLLLFWLTFSKVPEAREMKIAMVLLLGFMLTQIVGWVQVARLDGQTAAEQDSQDD